MFVGYPAAGMEYQREEKQTRKLAYLEFVRAFVHSDMGTQISCYL